MSRATEDDNENVGCFSMCQGVGLVGGAAATTKGTGTRYDGAIPQNRPPLSGTSLSFLLCT